MRKSRLNKVKQAWLGLPETWRTQLASAWHTFIPAFIGSLLISFQVTGGTNITADLVLSILLAATRAGFKAVSVWFFSLFVKDSV